MTSAICVMSGSGVQVSLDRRRWDIEPKEFLERVTPLVCVPSQMDWGDYLDITRSQPTKPYTLHIDQHPFQLSIKLWATDVMVRDSQRSTSRVYINNC